MTAVPRRDGSREGARTCPVCSGPLPSSRARYCSRACQQQAYRLRHQPATADLGALRRQLQRQRTLVAHTIYQCPSCSERLVGQRRGPDCGLFGRSLGLGGTCSDCDQPILLTELLGLPELGAAPPRTSAAAGSRANPPPTTTQQDRLADSFNREVMA
jgi:MYND finger